MTLLAQVLLRVLTRLRPQRWLSPSISLPIFRRAFGSTSTPGAYDLVLPDGPGPHPLVVWVHGGGWYFGDKVDVIPHLELLAAHGYAGAAVNYPLAPAARHPAAPRQVNETVADLLANAEALGLDPDRVVLAGDSAGAQVAAEVVTLTTNPTYAARTGLAPALRPEQLRGALLFCGIYDPTGLDDSDRMFAAVLGSAMWSLSRSRDWRSTETCRQMDVLAHADSAFPPTLLAAGDADPLTRRQSIPMAARLEELGVEIDAFLPGDGAEPVGHEFQFALGTPAGDEAFARTLAFLEKVTSISH
ncbi:MAG: alpha/beta hydrolase [Marmoricola sp.]|nr:alpha/beta hydrolase [Marmoricola sp.]